MPTPTNDEGFHWLLTLIALPFAGGVGWLVKYFTGRRSEHIQLGLTEAQTDAVRAQIRRDDRAAEFAELRGLVQEAWANVDLLKHEAAEQRARANANEAEIERLLTEQRARHKMVNELNAFRLKWTLLKEGVSLAEVESKVIEPIYPEAEIDMPEHPRGD